jgi:integrase
MAEGINLRHARSCPGSPCRCSPTYVAEVYIAAEAKRKRQSFGTLREARRWRAAALLGADEGSVSTRPTATVREAAERFLADADRSLARNRSGDPYKPSVLRTYESALRLRILPALGAFPLADVRRRDVQRIADEMLAEGASPSLIRNTLLPLRVIYRRAIEDEAVKTSPVAGIRLPAVRGRRERIASPSEAAALLSALDRDRALWATAFYAGLRRGELLALRWEDVDLASGRIKVGWSWDVKAGRIEPKSAKGKRVVPIPGELREALLDHRLATWEEGLVFGTDALTVAGPTGIYGRARRAWLAAGLAPIGLHEARHTFASICIAAGVNAKAISTYMGHSSIDVTFDLYGHLMPGSEDEAAGLIDAYLVRANTAARLAALEG